jgi:hypothetical protein
VTVRDNMKRLPSLLPIALLAALTACLAAQPRITSRLSNIDELLALSDQTKGDVDYRQVSSLVNALPALERTAVLHRLIGARHYGLAADAARTAIRVGDASAASIIAARIYNWPPTIRRW